VVSSLFQQSRLAAQGLVDPDALLATYADYRGGRRDHEDALLGAVVLELTIRSLERNQGMSRPRADCA